MIGQELLKAPLWEAKHLGQAIPNSPHAVSVALPRWSDVIAYEENEPTCINALQSVYPRFGLNPLVKLIARKALEINGNNPPNEFTGWPYPNLRTAKKAKDFCEKNNAKSYVKIQEIAGLQCLIVDALTTPHAKAFWQHTGLGASSRQAAIALNHEKAPSKDLGAKAELLIRNRLAKIYKCDSDLIHLFPSGMAALTTALEALNKYRKKKPALQLGFPYVDVLKLPQEIFNGSELFLKTDPIKIANHIAQKQPSALIVELPSNPMLQCIDLPLIAKIARAHGIPIIADDTIGSAINIDPLPYADLVFTSLTKSFSGRGDILAGSLTISPESPWAKELKEIIPSVSLAHLADSDAIALEKASKNASDRIRLLNESCSNLKSRLEGHPEIQRVLHPTECPNFKSLMRPNAGFGCLLSFELKGGIAKAKKFYNSLQVCKGPSLGTLFTLACPYVLLAHYKELDWAQSCGVPPHLIRVSVGLEKSEDLWDRFNTALKA